MAKADKEQPSSDVYSKVQDKIDNSVLVSSNISLRCNRQ
jgi:hypothetical protein